jgi:hypothetical protein
MKEIATPFIPKKQKTNHAEHTQPWQLNLHSLMGLIFIFNLFHNSYFFELNTQYCSIIIYLIGIGTKRRKIKEFMPKLLENSISYMTLFN